MEPFSVRSRLRSFRFALRGLRAMLRSQHNAWIHALASAGVVAAGLLLELGAGEWIAITLAVVAVWTAEALNTALEALCDVASAEFHPRVELAKDVAAGAVLIAAVGAVVVGVLVFVPRLADLGG